MEFPEQDRYWTQTREAARKCIDKSESVVAHDLFLPFFPAAQPYRVVNRARLKNIDWLILHKDNGRAFAPQILGRLKFDFRPVFANEVFVILINNRLLTTLCRKNNPADRSRVTPVNCEAVHVNPLFGDSKGKTWSMKRRWRVPITWLCAVAIFFLAHPTPLLLAAGGALALAGLLIRAWANGYVKKNTELAIYGPYAHVRHPLYFGNFLIGAGFVAASGNWLLGCVFMALVAGIYAQFMHEEDKLLGELFGYDYWFYSASVPKFFPRLLPVQTGASPEVKFDPLSYFRRGEYRALVGVVILLGLLALKARLKY